MSAGAAGARINVLFVLNSAGVGGAEMQTITLLNGLDPGRFRVSLAYLKDESELLAKVDRGRVAGAVFCCHVARKLDWRAARQLAAFVRTEAVDIVVCTNTYPLLYGWLARCLSGRAAHIVEVFHSTELASLKGKIQMFLYRPLLRVCDTLVYVCENQRRYWRARLVAARQDVVIHNGVDTEYFDDRSAPASIAQFRAAHGFSPTDYVIGLCAYMRPEKAHGDLLEALGRARGAGVDAKCLFIGDGPQRSAIEARIGKLLLGKHVAITGLVADVRLAIAACDVLVIASHNVETLSIAALESMAMGKPMIMTDIGGASEQVVHAENGYLYERGNIDSLTENLLHLSDPARRRKMGRRARSTVADKFSLATMIAAYERLFVGLMKPAPLNPDGAHGG